MKTVLKNGFLILNSENPGPTYVVPHSGITLLNPITRDRYTEQVAMNLLKYGGKAIISLIPREKLYGVDFCRKIPPLDIALNSRKFFIKNDYEKKGEFEKKFAFVALNKNEYNFKKQMYENFLTQIKNEPQLVFIHTQWTFISNHPSIMDWVCFDNKSRKKLKKIIEVLNKKYEDEFKNLFSFYKEYLKLETKIDMERVKAIFGCFDLKNKDVFFEYEKSIERIEKFLGKKTAINEKNFMTLVEKCLKISNQLKLTLEYNFSGKLAHIIKKIRGIKLEVECNEFLCLLRPELTAKIIWDVVRLYDKTR